MAAAVALLMLAAVTACDHAPHESAAEAASPAVARADTRDLILLPDSAIVAPPGSLEERLAHYLASNAPAPQTFRFDHAGFAPWADRPDPATLRTMYGIAQILRAYPNARVLLTGYTDNVGTHAQNRALATARVGRLARLLAQGGVAPRRIAIEGKGATDFVAGNATEGGRARNRRIELTITSR